MELGLSLAVRVDPFPVKLTSVVRSKIWGGSRVDVKNNTGSDLEDAFLCFPVVSR